MTDAYDVAGTAVIEGDNKVNWSRLVNVPSPLITTLSAGLRDTSGSGATVAVGFRRIEAPTTTSLRLHTQIALSDCNCNCACDCGCFPAGTRILMPDASQKLVEDVRIGDVVMGMDGPTRVTEVYHIKLNAHPLFAFADGSLSWKGGHTFWVRRKVSPMTSWRIMADGTQQWIWSRRPDLWRDDVETGIVAGLKDIFSIWGNASEPCEEEFAHLAGFKRQRVIEVAASPDTPIYAFHTEDGSMAFANGYMVGAGINEGRFDYRSYAWQGDEKWLAIAS